MSLQQYDHIYLFELFGLPINATIVSTWIVMLVLFLISFLATRHLKADVHVSKFQTLLEWMVTWLNDEVKKPAVTVLPSIWEWDWHYFYLFW